MASVQFYLDGKPLGAPVTKLPYAIKWDSTQATNGIHAITAVATDTSGNTAESSPVEVTVENPAEPGPCFVVDVKATVQGGKTVATPPLHHRRRGRAAVRVRLGRRRDHQAAERKVAGGGVKWRLVRRANSQPGTAEIWAGEAKKPIKNKFVKSIPEGQGL